MFVLEIWTVLLSEVILESEWESLQDMDIKQLLYRRTTEANWQAQNDVDGTNRVAIDERPVVGRNRRYSWLRYTHGSGRHILN